MATPKNDGPARPSTHSPTAADYNPFLAWVKCAKKSGFIDGNASLSEIHRDIITGKLEPQTTEYRRLVDTLGKEHADTKAYKKKNFRGQIVGGKLSPSTARKGQFPNPHSELVQFDVDKIPPDRLPRLLAGLKAHPAAALVFESPSRSLKALVRVSPAPATVEEHRAAWERANRVVCEALGLDFDSAADDMVKSANGLCFVCHDPEAHFNPAAEPIPWTMPDTPPAPEEKPPTDGKATGARTGKKATGTLADARAALQTFDASSMDYNHWLGWVTAMKEAGFSLAEAEAWSSRSTKHTNGYLAGEWDGLPANAPSDEACGNIIGFAIKNHGFKGKGKAQAKLQDWHGYGEHLGKTWYQGKYRFDSERDEWWRWTGTFWTYAKGDIPAGISRDLGKNRVELDKALDKLSATYKGKDGEENRVLCLTERNLNTHRRQGIARGLQVALDRPFPNYLVDQPAREARSRLLATPAGVVDLVTGTVEPHDPLRHDTRAVTTGSYNPDDVGEAEAMLRKRLALVFDDGQFDNYKIYLGMTVSGEGQSFRGVILCQGGSGSGKGGLNGLQAAAWGRRAHVLPMSMLERATQEIDVTRYALMRDQPLFLLLDENGAVNTSTLNSITGNNPLPAARLPYMTWGYKDTIPGVVWWTTIETPALRRRTGIDRRIGYLAFQKGEIPDAAKDANQFYPQALLDAMVTVGVQQAMLWRKREISDPTVKLPKGVIADMDPVQQAISDLDPHDWADKPVSMAREHVAKEAGDQRINATSFGNAVSLNDVWRKERVTVGEYRNRWVLKLRR